MDISPIVKFVQWHHVLLRVDAPKKSQRDGTIDSKLSQSKDINIFFPILFDCLSPDLSD